MKITPERLIWVKSSYSGTTENCVELAFTKSTVLMRDSKDPAGGTLHTSATALRALLTHLT